MKNFDRKNESLAALKTILKVGDTIYGIVKKVSPSGLSRVMRFYVIKENNPVSLTSLVGDLLGSKHNYKIEGVVIKGCGIDVCADTVFKVSNRVFGNETKLKAGYL